MTPIVIGVLGILLLFLLLAMRMQIGFAFAAVGFVGFGALATFSASFSLMGMEPFKISASYGLTVIPLFVLMGQFANYSNMGTEAYRTVYRWIGFLPGGMAMATIGACACFAAISGSSLAAAATLGMVAIPEMQRFKYSDALATGCVAAGGTLGILIPPSTVMIIYGILTEQPIGTLFIAGILPGLLLTVMFMATIYVQTRLRPELGPPGPRFTLRERIYSLKDPWGIMVLFVMVMGGLYTGWFTPTEAAGVGAFGAFVIMVAKGRLTWEVLKNSLAQTTRTTAMVFLILIGAHIFGYFLTLTQIPSQLSSLALDAGLNRYVIMGFLVIAYMILGCIMEGLAIMVLTIPIVFPMIRGLGFDPIWFGIVITLVMEMSLITPPIGVNVFIISGLVKDVPMHVIFRGTLPFFLTMILFAGILIIFPGLSLFLPAAMGR